MLLNTTNKRVSKMIGDTRKMKDSKRYIKEANKSTRALFKDIRDEVTGGKFNAARSTINSMREEAKMQKRGFYTTAFKKAWNDTQLVHLSKEYGKSVKNAVRTGKLYRRENDIFDDMMTKQNKFMQNGSGGSDSIEQAWDRTADRANSTSATYDAAKAQISSMNINTSAQLDHARKGIAETKLGFMRMTSAMAINNQQQVEAINGIHSFMNNVLKGSLNTIVEQDKQRNALLTEIRDLNKKMVINNDTYQQANIEKDKSVLDLVMEGRFKDAFGKGTENMIKEFDTKGIVQQMSYALPTALQMAISNPFGFIKEMILDDKTKLGKLRQQVDPKKLMNGKLMDMLGSNNEYVSRTAKAMLQNSGVDLKKTSITSKSADKTAVQWSSMERQALTQAIPQYLREILAALTGEEEKIWSYKKLNGGSGMTTGTKMVNEVSEYVNRPVGNSGNGATLINTFYKAEEKRLRGRDTNYSHAGVFDQFVKDMAMSGYPTNVISVLKWDYKKYKEIFPRTPLTKEDWALLTFPAKALIADHTEAGEKFRTEMMALDKQIEAYKTATNEFYTMLNQDADLSGYSALVDSDNLKRKGKVNSVLGRRKSTQPPGPSPGPAPTADPRSTSEIVDDMLKINNDPNAGISSASEAELKSMAGNDQTAYAKLLDRANYTNAKDFQNSGFKINAYHFRKWLDENYKKMPDDLKNRLQDFAKNEKFEKIIPHVKDFGLYLDQVRYADITDTTKLTAGEQRKLKELTEMKSRQGQFNSAFDGLERSVNDMTNDPAKMDAMSGFIKKMAVAGGIAGIAGAKGLIPFAGHMGLGGITAMALGGVALTALSHRKELASLLTGGMTEEEKANGKKVASFVFSKAITGLGVGSIAGLGAAVLGAGPVMAPLIAATTGIAIAMNSEKSGFKSFFFGDDHDKDKTFFQLFKTKMLGDKDTQDDGLFGRFLNPIFEKTGGLFDNFNKGLKDKVLDPLAKGMKTMVEKIDASSFGEKFKDAMGFTLSEFGGIMKKNVWTPLTKGIFGGIKKLFGWGRKKKDHVQSEMTGDLLVGDSISAMTQGISDADPTVGNPGSNSGGPTPGSSSGNNGNSGRNNGSGRKGSSYGAGRKGNGRKGYNGFSGRGFSGGSVIKGKGGLGGLTAEDIMSAVSTPFGDLKGLIGKGESNPERHYYTQLDPKYKDIKMGLLGFTNIGDAGCAIMAAAMVLSKFGKIKDKDGNKEMSPKFVQDSLIPMAKPYTTPAGVDIGFFQKLANTYNMEHSSRTGTQMFTIKEMKGLLSGGKGSIVALTTQKTLGNHYIVITGINGTNVYYDDPARKRNMVMHYDDFCEGTKVAIGLTKTKGLFGFIGKLLKGAANILSGENQKNKQARRWGIRRELIDRMTRDEWQKFRNQRNLPDSIVQQLKVRNPMINNFDGSAIKDDKGQLITDRAYAQASFDIKLRDQLAGAGAGKKGEKPNNAVTKIPGKSTYLYHGGGMAPSHINKGVYFKDETHFRSMMLSATLHQTSTVSTLLAAIYTKLSEQEVTIYNGTNGVAYNVEAMKRMYGIKAFGGMDEANKAIGPIDQNKLANSRFFGRRKGILGAIGQFGRDAKDFIKSKTIDPIVMTGLMIKMGFDKAMEKLGNGITNIMNFFQDIATGLVDGLKGVMTGIGTIVGGGLKMIGKAVGGLLSGIGSAFKGLLSGIGSAISGAIGGFADVVGSIVGGLVDVVKDIPNLIGGTINALTGAVSNLALGTLSIASSLGSKVYGAAKTVVKDIWGVGKAVVGGGTRYVKSLFSDTGDNWRERDITYVQVVGGHIDTVGAVGSVDRDAYVEGVKQGRKRNKSKKGKSKKQPGADIGADSTKKSKVNDQLDADQDKATSTQDKQTELLEDIANNEGGGSGTGEGKKKTGMKEWLEDLALVAPILAWLMKDTVDDLLHKTPGQTPEGNDTVPMVNARDPENKKKAVENMRLWDPRKIRAGVNSVKIVGKFMWNGAVRNSAAEVAGELGENIAKNKKDWVEIGGKAGTLAKKVGTTFTKVFGEIFDNPKVVYVLEKAMPGSYKKIVKNLKLFSEKILTFPAVVKGLAGDAGKQLAKGFSKALPFINIGFCIYDFLSGWNRADEYFNIPEPQLPLYLKLVSAIGRLMKGVIEMVPIFIFISVLIPDEVFVQFIYEHLLNGGQLQKDEVKKLSDEAKKKYDDYKNSQGPGKAKTFDEWVKDPDGKKNTTKKDVDKTIGPGGYAPGGPYGESEPTGTQYAPGMPGTNTPGANVPGGSLPTTIPTGSGAGTGKRIAVTTQAVDRTGGGSLWTSGYGANSGAAGAIVSKGGTYGANSSDYSEFINTVGKKLYLPTTSNVITSKSLLWRKSTQSEHKGVDFRAGDGTPVYSIAYGKVIAISTQPGTGYGKYIRIKHGNYFSLYAHLSSIATGLTVGKTIDAGTLIGYSGHSGTTQPHLHFEIRKEENKGQKNTVINPAKVLTGTSYAPGIEDSAVFGSRFGRNTGERLTAMGTGIASTMFGQNYKLNMGVGGDELSLSQVGCGPVTTNLFLQESGVREPLATTARALRYKRSTNEGFDSSTLSSYISSKRVGNKVLTTGSKQALMIAKFGIVFARRNSAINGLDDHHALFMKSTTSMGATLFDPYLETYKFYTWESIISSAFEFIIPSGNGNVSGPKRTDTSILRNAKDRLDMTTSKVLGSINETLDRVNVAKPIPSSPNMQSTVSGPMSNNINLEAKLDVMITLLTQIVTNTAMQTASSSQQKTESGNAINNVVKNIMKIASAPRDTRSQNDAWYQNKLRMSKGGSV